MREESSCWSSRDLSRVKVSKRGLIRKERFHKLDKMKNYYCNNKDSNLLKKKDQQMNKGETLNLEENKKDSKMKQWPEKNNSKQNKLKNKMN